MLSFYKLHCIQIYDLIFRHLEYKIVEIFKGETCSLIRWQIDKIDFGYKN